MDWVFELLLFNATMVSVAPLTAGNPRILGLIDQVIGPFFRYFGSNFV